MSQECRLANCLLSYDQEEPFTKSHWPVPDYLFLVYRGIMAIYSVAWLYYGTTLDEGNLKYPWPVFLTNWSYAILTVHFLIAFLLSVLYKLDAKPCIKPKELHAHISEESSLLGNQSGSSTAGYQSEKENRGATESVYSPENSVVTSTYVDSEFEFRHNQPSIPYYLKFTWVTYSIVFPVAFVVTFVYFVMLYPQSDHPYGPSVIDINVHGINSVMVCLEVIIAGYPVRILHLIYPLLYMLAYLIFSVIYWSYDHSRVWYPDVLDWNKPGDVMLLACIVGFLVLPMLQLLHFGIYKLKCRIHNANIRYQA